ncbi:DUF1748-domain-containing protein [Conidiobolus coronatus NRRL 28638]|uniref:DUF1748-domain-containing protein n=1 Tax=Conidiobolus coronatus (strain ATCC 28846 / CBS 209.66 / NRRL 28638) TaxID=796925 RepID=A0A137P1V5_CONC2|nr:DUF1748-domain-containing protein [Conidiobolus coronatus NRRL 28638]|eukprot:KXN68938.1 DUF1748-domain-containing protein [Conidiobolus coronatus NRRL 28638]
MSLTGKLIHLTADAVLVSAVLAGIRRSSGYTIKREEVPIEPKSYIDKYLDVGEWVIDQSIFFMSNSKFFERRKP